VVLSTSYLFCLVGALAAFGVIENDQPSLSTVLGADTSFLAPALSADRIWWVVLVGLGVYVLWMWRPQSAGDERGRAIAYPASAAMSLLGIWFFLVRATDMVLGAIATLVVLASLVLTLRIADRVAAHRFLGRLFTQFGLAVTTGWVAVLSAETIGAAFVQHHVRITATPAETWGILAVTALLAAGMALLRYLPGRLYIACAMSWGFVWMAYARIMGEPRAYGLALVALISSLLVLLAALVIFFWARGRVRERTS
jgi:hypothetical protein